MAKSVSALFKFGLIRAIFFPHNADKTRATYSNMLGYAGTMDFSSALAPAAIPGIIRADGGDEIDFTIDLDDAGIDIDAVTPAEWVAAVTAGLAAASPAITGYTASVAATTGRCKFVKTTSATIVEVYGLAFELAGFGQGKGLKAIVCEELESSTPSPTRKEDQEVTVTNAANVDTSVTTKGYKKGFSVVVVDNSRDFNLEAFIEGGTIDSNGVYHEPSPTQSKAAPSFELWTLCKNYEQGENQENDFIGLELAKYYNGLGNVSGGANNSGFNKFTYTLTFKNEGAVGAAEYRNLDNATDAALISILEAI
jgi:hypothetical protein